MGNKFLEKYTIFLRGYLKIKKPLRVVFDCSNGPTGLVLKKVFAKQKKIAVKYLNSRPDGNFPAHGPNPLEPGAMKQLQESVRNFRADIGVAYDADGDRSFFVDNKGQILPSYLALYLLSRMSRPPIVADIMTYEAMKYAGLMPAKNIFPSKVGTRLVRETMKKRRAGVGGEFSCHFFFKELADADSGIMATAKILSAISAMPYSLNDFQWLLPNRVETEYYSLELENMATSEKILVAFEKKYSRQALAVSKLDGLTFEFPNGWLVLRNSNTEPILRIFIGRLIKNKR